MELTSLFLGKIGCFLTFIGMVAAAKLLPVMIDALQCGDAGSRETFAELNEGIHTVSTAV